MTAGERCWAEDPTTPQQQRHATKQPQLRSYATGESEELHPREAGHSKAGAIQRV